MTLMIILNLGDCFEGYLTAYEALRKKHGPQGTSRQLCYD